MQEHSEGNDVRKQQGGLQHSLRPSSISQQLPKTAVETSLKKAQLF